MSDYLKHGVSTPQRGHPIIKTFVTRSVGIAALAIILSGCTSCGIPTNTSRPAPTGKAETSEPIIPQPPRQPLGLSQPAPMHQPIDPVSKRILDLYLNEHGGE